MNTYLEQAEQFLKDFDAKLSITYVGMGTNKNWGETRPRPEYRFTITTPLGKMTETFWDSIVNKNKLENGEYDGPDAYDILSCLDPYADPGDFEEFCREFGYERETTQEITMAKNIYYAVQKECAALKRIFTEEQLEKLAEIN